MQNNDIVIEKSTPLLRRTGRGLAALASIFAGLAASMQASGGVIRDFGRSVPKRPSREMPSFTPYVNKRTGEPHGRSGDKLIRKAMRRQVGRAVLR